MRPVLLVAGCAALMAAPWIARSWILYENPAAPFANRIFRNPYVHVMFEKEYTAYFRHNGVEDLRTLPLEVTVRGGKTAGLIGPVFLLLPLALVALRYPAGRRLLAAGALVFATYFGNVGTRFLVPCLPFLSLALALAIGERPLLLAAITLFHAATSWPSAIPRYADTYAWRIDSLPYREALRLVPQDEYLMRAHYGYAAARMIEGLVPAGESVWASNGAPDSYTRREIRVSFQSASNEVLTDILHMGHNPDAQPTRARVFRFPARPLRSLRVLQTAAVPYPEQWSVHELRLYHAGAELPRAPEWRLRAWPMPGYVQLAFDNSPVTRWRSWETAAQGMYLEVDLGREQPVDEVRLETSRDYLKVRLEVQRRNEAGQWEKLADQPEDREIPAPKSARRAATRELHDRGLHYILMWDMDWGADDIREDPEGWGLQLVGDAQGARLYKDIW
jgi:hypothetical protein